MHTTSVGAPAVRGERTGAKAETDLRWATSELESGHSGGLTLGGSRPMSSKQRGKNTPENLVFGKHGSVWSGAHLIQSHTRWAFYAADLGAVQNSTRLPGGERGIRKKGHNWTSGRRDRDARAEGGAGRRHLQPCAADFLGPLKCAFFSPIYTLGNFLLEICNNLEKLTDEPRSVGIPKGIMKQVLL